MYRVMNDINNSNSDNEDDNNFKRFPAHDEPGTSRIKSCLSRAACIPIRLTNMTVLAVTYCHIIAAS